MAVAEVLYDIVRDYYIAIVAVLTVAYIASIRYERNLRDIPGPFIASFTNLWRFWDAIEAQVQFTHIKLHEKYNSKLVRIGPRVVSVSDPGAAPIIYSLNSGFIKSQFYPVQQTAVKGKFTASLFNTTDEDYHQLIKRPIANAYSMSTLVEFEPFVDSTSSVFMKKFERFADSGQVMDLGVYLQRYAFDVIGEITFSKRLGFLETDSDVDNIIRDINTKLRYSAIIGQMPILDKFLAKNPILLKLGAPTHPITAFARKRLQERFSSKEPIPAGRRDFLQRTLEAKEKHPDIVDDARVLSYNAANVFAGSDTTAISLRSIVYYLLKTPSALRKLQEEIDGFDREGKLSEFVSWTEANRMPYLMACIKEGLRMHPAVGLLLERIVPKQGVTLCGQFIPAGTIVGINPWVVHRSKEVFGEDATLYRPERWLEAEGEQLKLMERTNFAFGYPHSARVCVGKNISLLEMYKLIPQLFRRYDLELDDPKRDWTLQNAWFVGQKGLTVRVRRRL